MAARKPAAEKSASDKTAPDKNLARYIDCNNMPLPFGPQFVADIVNRTHNAQDQTQCLLAAELVIKAQMNAKQVTLEA